MPIERCSHQLVPRLEHLRYEVEFLEFEGGHVVHPSCARMAMQWLLQDELQRLGIPVKLAEDDHLSNSHTGTCTWQTVHA